MLNSLELAKTSTQVVDYILPKIKASISSLFTSKVIKKRIQTWRWDWIEQVVWINRLPI